MLFYHKHLFYKDLCIYSQKCDIYLEIHMILCYKQFRKIANTKQ